MPPKKGGRGGARPGSGRDPKKGLGKQASKLAPEEQRAYFRESKAKIRGQTTPPQPKKIVDRSMKLTIVDDVSVFQCSALNNSNLICITLCTVQGKEGSWEASPVS